MPKFIYIPSASGGAAKTFYEMIQAEGITSGLGLCLDASDAASYPGSGQYWYDTAGGGPDFYLGNNASANAYDPTFVGSGGGLSDSEYFSFNGTTLFTSTGTTTLLENMPMQNTATTLACMIYIPSGTARTPNIIHHSSNCKFGFFCSGYGGTNYDGRLQASYADAQAGLFTYDAWNFIVFSMTIGTKSGSYAPCTQDIFVNGTFTSVSDPAFAPQSLADGAKTERIGYTDSFNSGVLLNSLAIWTSALTSTQMASLYSQMQQRFSALP